MSLHPTQPPLVTTDDLLAFWRTSAASCAPDERSLWLAFHDGGGRVHTSLTQIGGLPLVPDAEALGGLERLVRTVVAESDDVEGVLVLLERPGTRGDAPFEHDWADAIALRLVGALSWPVAVSICGDVSVVTPRAMAS